MKTQVKLLTTLAAITAGASSVDALPLSGPATIAAKPIVQAQYWGNDDGYGYGYGDPNREWRQEQNWRRQENWRNYTAWRQRQNWRRQQNWHNYQQWRMDRNAERWGW